MAAAPRVASGIAHGFAIVAIFLSPIVAGRYLFARREAAPLPTAEDRISSVRLGHLATTRLKLNSLRVCWMDKTSGWKEWAAWAAMPYFANSPWPGKDSIIYEVTVEVDYGVPVDTLTPDRIKREHGQMVVRVPPPGIIGLPKIVMEESGRRDQRTEGSRPVEYEKLDQQVRDAAQKHAEEWATKLGANEFCRERTRTMLRFILQRLINDPSIQPVVVFDDEKGGTP